LELLRHAKKRRDDGDDDTSVFQLRKRIRAWRKRCTSMRSWVSRFTVRTLYPCGKSLPLVNGSQLDPRSVQMGGGGQRQFALVANPKGGGPGGLAVVVEGVGGGGGMG